MKIGTRAILLIVLIMAPQARLNAGEMPLRQSRRRQAGGEVGGAANARDAE